MKSQTRAWLVAAGLFLAWSTVVAAPFRYFAEMLRDWSRYLSGLAGLSDPIRSLLTYGWISLFLILFLLAGRSRQGLYLAGIFALAEVTYHLVICLRNGQLYDVSLPITIGLALALLFLLIKSKSPSLWLSDAFICALAVWQINDTLLAALFDVLKLNRDTLAPLIRVPENALIFSLRDFWHLPLAVWALIAAALVIVPLVFLASRRQKG